MANTSLRSRNSARNAFLALFCLLVAVFVFKLWRSHGAGLAHTVEGSRDRGGPALARSPIDPTVPKSSVSGLVTDSDAKPVGGAHVCAVDVVLPSASGTCVDSDPQGHYAVLGLPAGGYLITASRDGFVAGAAQKGGRVDVVDGVDQTGVNIVLQEGGARVTGFVVDATGGPIPHATVRAERNFSPRAVVDIEADDLGHFTLWFPPGPLSLTARSSAYAPAEWIGVAPSADVRLSLTPGATMRGLVVSSADGSPVANAEVRAASSTPTPPTAALSGADGTFVLHGLEPGSYTLVAIADGLRGETRQPIALPLAATVEQIRIQLDAAFQVTGLVLLSKTLQPCEEGAVTLGLPDLRQPPVEGEEPEAAIQHSLRPVGASVGAGGVVRFAAVPRGRYYVTVQCKDNALREGPRVLDVGTSDLSNLTWKVGTALGLTILTVDELNRPVPSAQFIVKYPRWSGSRPPFRSLGSTDGEGRYVLSGELFPGTYEIAGGPAFETEPVRIELRDGDAPTTVRLRISGSASILATVKTREGRLLDGLMVTAVAISGTGDDGGAPSAAAVPTRPKALPANALGEGQYRIAPLKPGRYEVRVDDRVNETVRASVAVASGAVAQADIEIDRKGHIRGHVVDESGVPIPEVWVTARAISDRSGSSQSGPPNPFGEDTRVLTDPDGRFVLDRLTGGDTAYSLRADQPSGGVVVKDGVSVSDADVELRLPALGSVAGTVEGDCGDPTKPLTVYATNQETGQNNSQTLSGPGSFRLAIGPGHVQLIAACRSGAGLARTTTEVSPKADVTGIRLTLEAPTVSQPPVGGPGVAAPLRRTGTAESEPPRL